MAKPPMSPSSRASSISVHLGEDVCERRRVIPVGHVDFAKCLGAGTFGEVFQATWRNHVVAVKSIYDDDLFREEAELLSVLSHRNIIRYYGEVLNCNAITTVDGSTCPLRGHNMLVTEFMPGGTLHDRIYSNEAYKLHDMISWMLDIVSALAYLHFDGPACILHLDLKPLNVLLTRGGVCKLADLGASMPAISRSKDSIQQKNSSDCLSQKVRGTPRYMAPEVIRGSSALTDRADIWSFGVLCAELVARQEPFPEHSNNFTISFLVGTTFKHPDMPDTMPATLRSLLLQTWLSEPQDRPSAHHIRHELETYLCKVMAHKEEDVTISSSASRKASASGSGSCSTRELQTPESFAASFANCDTNAHSDDDSNHCCGGGGGGGGASADEDRDSGLTFNLGNHTQHHRRHHHHHHNNKHSTHHGSTLPVRSELEHKNCQHCLASRKHATNTSNNTNNVTTTSTSSAKRSHNHHRHSERRRRRRRRHGDGSVDEDTQAGHWQDDGESNFDNGYEEDVEDALEDEEDEEVEFSCGAARDDKNRETAGDARLVVRHRSHSAGSSCSSAIISGARHSSSGSGNVHLLGLGGLRMSNAGEECMSEDEETVKGESHDTRRSTPTQVQSLQQQRRHDRHHHHHHHPHPRRSSSGGSVFRHNSDTANSDDASAANAPAAAAAAAAAATGPLDRQRTLTPGVHEKGRTRCNDKNGDCEDDDGTTTAGKGGRDNRSHEHNLKGSRSGGSEEKSRSTLELLTSSGSSGSVFEPFDHESTHPLPHPYAEFGSPRLSRRSIDVDEQHLPFLSLASPTPPSPPPTATTADAPKTSPSSLHVSHTRPPKTQPRRQHAHHELLEGRSHLDTTSRGEKRDEGREDVLALDTGGDGVASGGASGDDADGGNETDESRGYVEGSETLTCTDTLTPQPSPPRSPLPSPQLSEREASIQAQMARLQLWEQRLAQREQELLVREAALLSKEEQKLKPKRLSRVFSSGDLSCSLSSSTSSTRIGNRTSFSKLVE